MAVHAIQGKNYQVHFNDEERIAYVIYRGSVTLETTLGVYEALGEILETNLELVQEVIGCVFDFTMITHLDVEAMVTAARKSVNFRLKYAHLLSGIPTALVVKNTYQEIPVTGSMQLARQTGHPRFRLVKSHEQAKAFFNEYHLLVKESCDAASPTDSAELI